ncbi:uncharacterized protein AAGF69_014330 [Amazona ochrocephala]
MDGGARTPARPRAARSSPWTCGAGAGGAARPPALPWCERSSCAGAASAASPRHEPQRAAPRQSQTSAAAAAPGAAGSRQQDLAGGLGHSRVPPALPPGVAPIRPWAKHLPRGSFLAAEGPCAPSRAPLCPGEDAAPSSSSSSSSSPLEAAAGPAGSHVRTPRCQLPGSLRPAGGG